MIYYCEERKGWMMDKLSDQEKVELYKIGEALVVKKLAESLVERTMHDELARRQALDELVPPGSVQ